MRIYRVTSNGKTACYVAATSLGRALFLAWQCGKTGRLPNDYRAELIGQADTTEIGDKNGEGLLNTEDLCRLMDTQNPMALFDRQKP